MDALVVTAAIVFASAAIADLGGPKPSLIDGNSVATTSTAKPLSLQELRQRNEDMQYAFFREKTQHLIDLVNLRDPNLANDIKVFFFGKEQEDKLNTVGYLAFSKLSDQILAGERPDAKPDYPVVGVIKAVAETKFPTLDATLQKPIQTTVASAQAPTPPTNGNPSEIVPAKRPVSLKDLEQLDDDKRYALFSERTHHLIDLVRLRDPNQAKELNTLFFDGERNSVGYLAFLGAIEQVFAGHRPGVTTDYPINGVILDIAEVQIPTLGATLKKPVQTTVH